MSVHSDEELPTNRQNSRSNSRASLGKRSRVCSYDNSSDGPYFSSDELSEACVENYAAPRIKRQYRGTWWEPTRSISDDHDKEGSRTRRTQDSGVFMASDGSSSSNEDGFGVSQLSTRNMKRNSKKLLNRAGHQQQSASNPTRQVDLIAQQIVEACLEADKEDVDLSRCSLTFLSNDTVRPLRGLIRRPGKHQNHQVEESFQSFSPCLKLYLSTNLLRQLPGEIMNLEHLTVLSIRNNKLTELPHSFGRLKNLVELNVSGNRLTWLPWEVLGLIRNGKLRNIHIYPNRFFLPFAIDSSSKLSGQRKTSDALLEEYIDLIEAQLQCLPSTAEYSTQRLAWLTLEERALSSCIPTRRSMSGPFVEEGGVKVDFRDAHKSQPDFLGATSTYLFGLHGVMDGLIQCPSRLSPDRHVIAPTGAVTPFARNISESQASSFSKAPSLLELALRSCSQNLIFTYIDRDLSRDTPEHLVQHLESARTASELGPTACSVCGVGYIIPQAEWIEYWHCVGQPIQIKTDELWVPFLRRACSWGCANRNVLERRLQRPENQKSIEAIQEEINFVKGARRGNAN